MTLAEYQKAEREALQIAHDALKAAEPYMSAELCDRSDLLRHLLRMEIRFEKNHRADSTEVSSPPSRREGEKNGQ